MKTRATRTRNLTVGVAIGTLLTSLTAAVLVAPPSTGAVLCDTSGVSPVSGKTGGGVTASTSTVTIGGVATTVCELTFKTVIDQGGYVTTTNSWTVPTDVTKVDVVVVAGGGGGGSAVNQPGTMSGGSGGGGGEVVVVPDLPVTGAITVQVGRGGLGAQNEDSNGFAGDASMFGDDAQADAGEGGLSYDEMFGTPGGKSGSGKFRGAEAEEATSTYFVYGGGGGGHQADGGDAALNVGGNGGAGYSATLGGLFGSESGNYGGGGGGGTGPDLGSGYPALTGGAATQGGGRGAKGSAAGADGNLWTGGGGGGGAALGGSDATKWGRGGSGADGIVRVRFILPAAPTPPDNGGGSSAPAPTPDPTPTPTATPTATAAPSLGPVANSDNPNIPAGGVPLGGSVFLLNGQPLPVTVKPDAPSTANATGLDVEGDGWRMRLVGRTANDRPLGVTPDGALILEQDRTAFTEGTGFQPNSEVKLYVFSEPRFLGTVATDANGSFRGSVPLPLDIAPGRHTLQSNGLAPDGSVRSLSLGVQVNALAEAAKPKVRSAKTTVFFAPLSSKLDATAKKSLGALAKGRAKVTTRIVSIGYVQPTVTRSNDESLSLARAEAVADYLKSIGVKGNVVAVGRGVAQETGAEARKVIVTIRYKK